MKVLEILGEPVITGGEEAFVMSFVSHVRDEAMEIDLYTPYYCANDYYRGIIEKRGGKVYAEGLPFAPGKSRSSVFQPLYEHLRTHRYDVVHIHSSGLSILGVAAKAAKKAGVPRILVHSHCAAEKETIGHLAAKTLFRHALLTAPTAYLACSKEAAWWKFPKERLEETIIVNNGVDLEEFAYDEGKRQAMREKLGIPEEAHVVGHVGRFSHQKNHEFLIRVFAEIKKREKDAHLLLVGEGELFSAVRQQVKEAGIEDAVHFAGAVSDVSSYLQAMDVFALPSLYEGLPIVGVEAQAAGLPIFVSENVSPELDVTGTVKYLPIAETGAWVTALCDAWDNGRADNAARIREAGYDIMATVEAVCGLYSGNARY